MECCSGFGKVALVADIKAMFHHSQIIREDQPALRFLWQNMEVIRAHYVYQILVTIFGAAPSPCTANYILRKTADDNCDDPLFTSETIQTVKRNIYMNDPL